MTVDTGSGRRLSLLEHFRRLHLRRATGLLSVTSHGRARELHLLEGELHFPAAHPLARRLADLRAPADDKARRKAWLELFDLFLPSLEGIRVAAVDFRAGRGALPGDLVGPVPTSALLRRAWGRGLDGAEPLPVSGPRVLRSGGGPPADLFGWTPEELWLFERLRQPRTVAELERESPMPAAALHAALRGLEAVELVVEARAAGHLAAPSAMTASGELAFRLRDRIAESLADEPLELAPEEANRRLVELLSAAGGQNHYELLGVSPGAEPDEVQAAFERFARLVHPAQAERLGFAARREALEYLFERGTDAYRVLSDPDLRMAYDREQGIDAGPAPADATERREEAERMARRALPPGADGGADGRDLHRSPADGADRAHRPARRVPRGARPAAGAQSGLARRGRSRPTVRRSSSTRRAAPSATRSASCTSGKATSSRRATLTSRRPPRRRPTPRRARRSPGSPAFATPTVAAAWDAFSAANERRALCYHGPRSEVPRRSLPGNGGRKVRTPTGSRLANGEARRRDGKCNREQTARVFREELARAR